MHRERPQRFEWGISTQEFEKILFEISDIKLSRYPQFWTLENPLKGTCVPVSMVAQTVFGGKLVRADLRPFPKFRNMYWHWANLLPDGTFKDFTKSQFGSEYPEKMIFIEKEGFSISKHPDVFKRYNLLYKRLMKFLDTHRVNVI